MQLRGEREQKKPPQHPMFMFPPAPRLLQLICLLVQLAPAESGASCFGSKPKAFPCAMGRRLLPRRIQRGSAIRAEREAPAAGRTANPRRTNTSQHPSSSYPRLYQVPKLTVAFQLKKLSRGKPPLKQKQKEGEQEGLLSPSCGEMQKSN